MKDLIVGAKNWFYYRKDIFKTEYISNVNICYIQICKRHKIKPTFSNSALTTKGDSGLFYI